MLRVSVVALVVVRHAYPEEWVGQSTVAGWSTPFFFVITGWLWSRGKRSTLGEARHRFDSLARPYLAWGALILVVVVAVLLYEDRLTSAAITNPLYGGYFAQRPFTTFWFISTLLFVSIYFRAVESNLVVATALAAAGLAAGFAFGPELARTPLAIGTALPCMSMVLFGYALKHLCRHRAAIPIALTVLVAAILASFFIDPTDIKAGDYGTPVVSLAVCCAIVGPLLVLAQVVRIPARIAAIATALAAVGVCVILTHPLVLWLLDTPSVGAPLWHLAAALLVPWTAGLVIARTRLAPWLLGR